MPKKEPSAEALAEKYTKKQAVKVAQKGAATAGGVTANFIMAGAYVGYEAYQVYQGHITPREAAEATARLGVLGIAPYGKQIVAAYDTYMADTMDEKVRISMLATSQLIAKTVGLSVGVAMTGGMPIIGGALGAFVGMNIAEIASNVTVDYSLAQFPEQYWDITIGRLFYEAQDKETNMPAIEKNWWDNDYTYLERVRNVYIEYEKNLRAFKAECAYINTLLDTDETMSLEQLELLENRVKTELRKKHSELEKQCYDDIIKIIGSKDPESGRYANIENTQRYLGYKKCFAKITREMHSSIRHDKNEILEKIAELKQSPELRTTADLTEALAQSDVNAQHEQTMDQPNITQDVTSPTLKSQPDHINESDAELETPTIDAEAEDSRTALMPDEDELGEVVQLDQVTPDDEVQNRDTLLAADDEQTPDKNPIQADTPQLESEPENSKSISILANDDFLALQSIAQDVKGQYNAQRQNVAKKFFGHLHKNKQRESQVLALEQALQAYTKAPSQQSLAQLQVEIESIKAQIASEGKHKLGESGLNFLLDTINQHVNKIKEAEYEHKPAIIVKPRQT